MEIFKSESSSIPVSKRLGLLYAIVVYYDGCLVSADPSKRQYVDSLHENANRGLRNVVRWR